MNPPSLRPEDLNLVVETTAGEILVAGKAFLVAFHRVTVINCWGLGDKGIFVSL